VSNGGRGKFGKRSPFTAEHEPVELIISSNKTSGKWSGPAVAVWRQHGALTPSSKSRLGGHPNTAILGPVFLEDVINDLRGDRLLGCKEKIVDHGIVAVPHRQRLRYEAEARTFP
jgi:hypothetical protein